MHGQLNVKQDKTELLCVQWNFIMTYTTAVFTVKNSWWCTEELSETCGVLFQK